MASIRTRTRKNGTQSHQVLWRDPDTGAQEAWTAPDAKLAELMAALLTGNGHDFTKASRTLQEAASSTKTLAQVLEHHIETRTRLGQDTARKYRGYIRDHLGELGPRPIDAINTLDMIEWVHWMQERGLKPKTIANVHGFLSGGMGTAVNRGWRPDNPCRDVQLPLNDAAQDKQWFLTHDEYRRVRSHLPDWSRPWFDFTVGTGCRPQETTVLEARDFDLDSPTPVVRISKAVKRQGDGSYKAGPPKTKAGRRTISLAPDTVEAVRPLVAAAQARGGHVFLMPNTGAWILPGALYHPCWKGAVSKAGLGFKPRVYDLRHTHASWMLAEGMSIWELSHRMGHENTEETTKRYGHLMPSAHLNGIKYAAAALGKTRL
ncbi:tyrosine-type recombinase/integrase [Arthrobacter woluwensis]|uniref:tyrosine-type recombinase/integrase n=1 Tax=Arthrobacter woluwensis TaxID=156980 RepID=UPI0015E786F7|nr:site-specific integrase [Arthrobacter woluwensis]